MAIYSVHAPPCRWTKPGREKGAVHEISRGERASGLYE